jgi:hypothetical protein
MAEAYARLVKIEELKSVGAGKLVSFADALRSRDDAEYGRRTLARVGRLTPLDEGSAAAAAVRGPSPLRR